MNIQKLCTDIATKEDGLEVIAILKKNNLWEDTKYWKLVGNNKDYNNHSIIGSQQSNPANALVEKLVNSGDSALMLKCLEKGIDPKSNEAPNNLKEAVATFLMWKMGAGLMQIKPRKTSLLKNTVT